MKVSCQTITFRIDIDFPEADVDVVLREIRAVTPVPSILTDKSQIPIDENKLPKTPKAESVMFALHWAAGYVNRRTMEIQDSKWDTDYGAPSEIITLEDGFQYRGHPKVKTELEEIGITVESWHGLMQGTCHLMCEVDASIFSPELISQANAIVTKIFKRFVKYYKQVKKAA